jgi:tRNA(Arg) A34 adenosine deaminase TadA
MAQAVALARQGVEAGAGGPFGALVVKEGRVLGRGFNRVIADLDPTAHAEILAVREACAAIGDFRLHGATLYATCEPCPMCLAAVHWARLARVVFAATVADAARLGFDDRLIFEAMRRSPGGAGLAMAQCGREEALEVFRLWQASPLRRDY